MNSLPIEKQVQMTDYEILTRSIKKAIANGWDRMGYVKFYASELPDPLIVGYYKSSHKDVIKTEVIALERVIYNKEFAKSFWGEEERLSIDESIVKEGWKHHLQQMVISDNPIKYLEQGLVETK